MTAAHDEAQVATAPINDALDAMFRLVAETEQRRSEQIRRIAQLGGNEAEVASAQCLLKEIEKTLGLARAYRSILLSL